MASSEEDLIERIENDEFYKNFLKPGPKGASATALTVAEQVKKLGDGIEMISQELQKQVLEKHDDLLRQGHHATKLDNVLSTINGHIQNLYANAERLRNQINGPYSALETHTKVLRRLHLASHILRQVNRIQQLSKRLSNTNDPVQKASILFELEQLTADSDLKDIDAVTSELRNIREQHQKVIKLATGSLNQGIINENGIQTSTALQVFVNLGTIGTTLQSCIDNSLSECRESLKAAFEISIHSSQKHVKGPGRIALSTSQGFRSKIWTELEKAFGEEIYQQCKHIKFLQQTVNSFNLENVDTDIAFSFWLKLGDVIQNEIKNSSAAVQQMLEEEYPKLLKCFHEMTEKLNYNKFVFDRQVLDSCENSYLSTSLTRLLDPAQSMFNTDGDIPSHDQIDSLIRLITNELSVALVEENLSEKISKNVSKCVKMYALKTEQQLETGPEAAQVIGGNANSEQQKNVQFANALFYLQVQVQRMLANMKESLPDSGVELIEDSIQVLITLTGAILQPLVASINSAIETIIITIHLEGDWAKLQVPPSKIASLCSPYMRELTQFINRVYHTYLIRFENKEVLFSKCSEIAIRCIELLVRHAVLLRPLSQGGRVRLQSDFAHLEHALKIICPQLSNLGRPYRLLKSVASLVTLPPQEIVASQASESSVPNSTVLLLLFSFAGADLASPHQNTGWSLPKLSNWLDEHPGEIDRLDLVAGALQRYEAFVMQKNSANYDPVYPLMSKLLETAIKNKK